VRFFGTGERRLPPRASTRENDGLRPSLAG
jgi:hypothetical protein